MNSIKILLLGTYHPTVPTLSMLIKRGYCCGLIMPPTEEVGHRNDELIKIATDNEISFSFSIGDIDKYDPDLVIASNYPKLIPQVILDKYKCINTHWSLLPRWRGVHGTAWAILNDDEQIGYTIHSMDGEFDTGQVLLQESVANTDDLGLLELHKDLALMQAEGLKKIIAEYLVKGEMTGAKQNEQEATYVPKRFPEDGEIDWYWPSRRIFNLVRILPEPDYPGAFTFHNEKKIILHHTNLVACPEYWATPGQVVRVKEGIGAWVKTGDTCLEVTRVRLEGESEYRQADQVLKRGMKLGRDLASENAVLRNRIEALEKMVSKIISNTEQ